METKIHARELIRKYRALEARVDAFVRPTLRKQAETAAEMQAILDELENDHGLYYVPDRRRFVTVPGAV